MPAGTSSSGSSHSSGSKTVLLLPVLQQGHEAAAPGGKWVPVQELQQQPLPAAWQPAEQQQLPAIQGPSSTLVPITSCSSSSSGGSRKKLPVTLLSGFLGAGKTTLLKHLLRNAGQRRIAVVVNDVAALNIDSALVKGGGLVESREQLVELQNGCVCCSLRVDLVQAIARLAAAGCFDLLLLESTGVSEPMQVAELFSADVPLDTTSGSDDAAAAAGAVTAAGSGGAASAAVLLRDVARLDTAVTVVDAHQLLHNLHSIHTVRGELATKTGAAAAGRQPPEAAAAAAAQAELSGSHRHIAELLLEQVECADVLLLNKADTVGAQELTMLQAVLSALNSTAKLITTTNSRVEPSEPAAAAAAALGPGAVTLGAARSTAAYGVTHFVYRARWPFHPARLHNFIVSFFLLQEPDWEKLMAAQGEDRARFGLLLRSKGFVWLATRGDHIGEWSQAGSLLSFSTGAAARLAHVAVWSLVLRAAAGRLAPGGGAAAELRADFAPCVGDSGRSWCSSMAVIDWVMAKYIDAGGGLGLKEELLRAALDECLVTVAEAEGAGFSGLPDPFEPWPDVADLVDMGEGEDDALEEEEQAQEAVQANDEGQQQQQQQQLSRATAVPPTVAGGTISSHDGAAAAAAAVEQSGDSVWCPGRVNSIGGGAAQLQQLMDDPMQVFNGPQAGQQLAQALQQMGLLTARPQAPVAAAAAGAAGPEPQLENGADADAGAGAPAVQQQQQQQGVLGLRKGATDLKQLLQQTRPSDLLLVAWSDSSSSSSLPDGLLQLLLQRAAAATPRRVLLAEADAAASQSNAALAAALNAAKQLPVVQVFHNKQLVKAVRVGGLASAADAAAKVLQAVGQLQLLLVKAAAAAPAAAGTGQQLSLAAASSSSNSTACPTAVPAPAAPSSNTAASDNSSNSSISSDLWDPPSGSKLAKPGSKKKFPAAAVYTATASSSSSSSSTRKPTTSKAGGSSSKAGGSSGAAAVSAVYWPRMPCLACGCPWWLGEDWDAACARCGWTCEDGGYDDDSNPLPQYRERYAAITAVLKQGRTPSDLQPLE
ncbi:CobW/HypB/UreG, nucleotide-binding domain-containing protein [Scenedesmus sp. NREL 46B-D3]|nr:CobW/HypB/UreG, nucleotide-binding domain-containing protein [Scenedesmus sp. NREL 46B-D3]